jgi:simple sugar transport system substrate-binding protein
MKILRALIGFSFLFSTVLAQAADTYYFIAHAGPGDPYWSIQAKGAQDAAQKLGVKVIFSAPDRAGDVAKQVELLNAAISGKPAGIVTTIPEGRAFERSVQKAVKAGIPIIAIDACEEKRDPIGLPYQAFIGMDAYEAGRKVGEKALNAFGLKPGATAVIGNHQPGVMDLEKRTKGIVDVLAKAGIKTKTLDIGSNPAKAETILMSFMKANPGVTAIFTLGPLGYTPAGKMIQDMKLQGKVQLAGFDVDPVGLDLLKKGIMGFTIDAQPYMQAFMAINQLYLASKYGVTAIDLNTGVGFLDKDNVEKFAKLITSGYAAPESGK